MGVAEAQTVSSFYQGRIEFANSQGQPSQYSFLQIAKFTAITNNGTLYGRALDNVWQYNGFSAWEEDYDGYSWTASGYSPQKLGTHHRDWVAWPGGGQVYVNQGRELQVNRVNNSGSWVGWITTYNELGQANLWQPAVTGTIVPFGPLDINESGVVVGSSYAYDEENSHAIWWDGSEHDLGLGRAKAINGVTRRLIDPDGFTSEVPWPAILGEDSDGTPVFWEKDASFRNKFRRTITQDLLRSDDSISLVSTIDINDDGAIVGQAYLNGDHENLHGILLIPADLAVDANRDGIIRFAGQNSALAVAIKPPDTTSQGKPYRFWINDDQDDLASGETVPATRPDYSDDRISTVRDLEDFARLDLYLGAFHDAILLGDIKVGLRWKNSSGNPAIKVWRNLSPEGGTEYLSNEKIAQQHLSLQAPGLVQGTVGSYLFPQEFWQQIQFSANQPTAHLLFEGAGEGAGELVVTFHQRDGTQIGEGPGVWLDLVNVKKMYERAKATPANIPQPQDSTVTPATPSVSYVLDPYGNQWDYPSVSWDQTKEYVIAIHGWRVTYEEARTYFAETTFKRLWQRGYRGRFAALYWSTLVDFDSYNESEYRAWFFGEGLKQYVNSLSPDYSKHLMAHSLGNVVAGSALRKGLNVENYALIDAAVPASCYDDSSTLHKSFGLDSPDHDIDQPTLALAYKNKLSGVNGTLINFYLASDDALDLWRLNQENFRPQFFYSGAGADHAYKYYPGNPSGQKLFLTFVLNASRNLEQLEESLAYAAKSSTLAVGAEGNTSGSIDVPVNLANFGYEDEHSAPWVFTVQKMKGFFDRLMDELGIGRNGQ